jgi:hypothetical protein
MPTSTISQSAVEVSWEDAMTGNFPESPYRQVFRQAVTDVATKAKAVLVDSHGRIDSAVKIVLAGDVKLLEDGTAQVASQSNGTVKYYIVNGECSCKDFPKAPGNFCKHRLAFGICKRATSLASERLKTQEGAASNGHAPETAQNGSQSILSTETAPESQVDPIPRPETNTAAVPQASGHHEAPCSMNTYVDLAGFRLQITLRGHDEHAVLTRVKALLAQFPAPQQAPGKPTDTATVPDGWCRRHDCQMTQNHKNGSVWWSHRLADGTWCKGK